KSRSAIRIRGIQGGEETGVMSGAMGPMTFVVRAVKGTSLSEQIERLSTPGSRLFWLTGANWPPYYWGSHQLASPDVAGTYPCMNTSERDEVRPTVQEFMRGCERLFGFANQNGGLTDEECRRLIYYSEELHTYIYRFCSESRGPSHSESCPLDA